MKLKKKEEYKNVEGYEGLYLVTSEGKIWSFHRNKMLQPFNTGNGEGYPTVSLSKDGKTVDCKVHILVAKAFIPNPQHKPQLNHKNGNKHDARACNLEWVTARENMQHAFDNKLNTHFRTSKADKLLICSIYNSFKISKTKLAAMFNVSVSAISYILKTYTPLYQ